MTILDRYIARQYLINALALTVILFSFVITIDVSLNFDRFSSVAEKLLKGEGIDASWLRKFLTTLFLILDLWWPRLLQLFNFMLGLVLVGAMGFTFSQLVKGRELVAVLASGVPLTRVARPVLLIALAMTLVQAVNQELVVPRIAGLLTRDHGDAGKRSLGSGRVMLCADAAGKLFYARAFDAEKGVLEDLYVWERDERGLATRRIHAKTATWRDGGWDLTGGEAESRRGEIGVPEVVARVETDLDPTSLTMKRFENYSQNMSFAQLGKMLESKEKIPEARREQLERLRWGRLSVMLSNMLSLVVAVPFFLRREPANMVAQSLKCAPVAILALMGGVLGASAAIPGMPAALGVFVPVLVLAPLAVAAATGVRT